MALENDLDKSTSFVFEPHIASEFYSAPYVSGSHNSSDTDLNDNDYTNLYVHFILNDIMHPVVFDHILRIIQVEEIVGGQAGRAYKIRNALM